MNDAKDGYAIAMTWLVTLVITIVIGVTTWYWLEPETAFEYFSFLMGWVLLSISGHFILKIIIVFIRKIT